MLSDHAGLKPWSVTCVEAVWKFASYVAPCPRNVGLAGFWNGTSEDHGNEDGLPTLGKQRWKDIVFGKALTHGLWRLLNMVIGCGSKRILCFSRCTLVDRVKSCISFVCALEGLPSGRQTLTLTLIIEHYWPQSRGNTDTWIDFGCGTSFAKRCSGMVHAQVECDKNIPLGLRLKVFNAVITPVTCFATGHRTLYPRDVRRYDIEMRKMLRRMIPPPVGIDWSALWHVILHSWHARMDTVVHQFAFLPWSALVSQSVSQSSQACTPRGEPFQGAGAKFHFIHTLHAHWLQKSKKPFNCCFHTTKSCAVSSQRPNLW